MRPALWMDDKPLSSKEPVIFKVIRYVKQKPLSLSFRELQVWLKQLRLFPSLKDLSQIVWKHWISIKLLFISGGLPFFHCFFFSLNFSLFEISVTIHCLIDFYLSCRTLLKDKMAANRKFLCMSFLITYLLPINFKVWVEEKRLLS